MITHEQTSADKPSPINTPMGVPPSVTSDDFALAFDIDGVLMKGGQPIPQALDAMKYINGENPYKVKVYVSFVLCPALFNLCPALLQEKEKNGES